MKKYRILALDGGGIRGLITAVWLQRLEEKLRGPAAEHFDLLAGTSTGSLLACALALGIPARQIVDLYRERGRLVFPGPASRLWSRFERAFTQGVSAPKYDGKGLDEELRRVFGGARLGELKRPTLAVSYDTFNRQVVVFKSYRERHAQLPVWQVCRASSSAPAYFPACIMELGEAEIPLIDGGVVANNPTACAIAEGVRLNGAKSPKERIGPTNFVVASFGTGELSRPITSDEATEWGALEWAIPLIDVLFDGSTDAVDYIATQILKEGNYFRFQTRLERAYDDLDDASATNVNALIATAQGYLAAGGEKLLDRLVKRI